MSPPALRAPARAVAVARHYLVLIGGAGGRWGVVAALVMTSTSFGEQDSFSGVRNVLLLALFAPLLHWRGLGRRSELDASMPFGRTGHDLLRVACGALWTAATVALSAGLAMAASLLGTGTRFGGYPGWYPLPAVTAGVTLYLLGSAVCLRARHPGRTLVLAYFLTFLGFLPIHYFLSFFGFPSVNGGTFEWALVAAGWSSAGGLQATPREYLTGAVTWLAVASLVVWTTASADGWLERVAASPAGRLWTALRRRLPARRRPPARHPGRRSGGVRRPAPLAPVLSREVALLGRRMAWPLFLLAVIVWANVSGDLDPANQAPPNALSPMGFSPLKLALFLPALVWLDARGARREYEEALPTGAATRRMLRLAAGATWLCLAVVGMVGAQALSGVAAGKIASLSAVPARVWIGVPGAGLTLYLLGSLPFLLAPRRLFVWAVSWYLALPLLGSLARMLQGDGPLWRLSPSAAFAPVGFAPGEALPWEGALLLWFLLSVAAASYATVEGARRSRTGRATRTRAHTLPPVTSPA